MTSQDDGYGGADWSAVEKGPAVTVGGQGGGPDHAGAALRALGSIWLVTLMFVFVVLAAFSVGYWALNKVSLTSDAVEVQRLDAMRDVINYKASLEKWSSDMSNDHFLALREPTPVPDLWRDILKEREDNDKLRDAFKQRVEEQRKRTNPGEPQCLDPIRRCR